MELCSDRRGFRRGYYLIMDVLQKPKAGLMTILNAVARIFLVRRLRQKELYGRYTVRDFEISNGQISLRPRATSGS
jgi:hypothetical protein